MFRNPTADVIIVLVIVLLFFGPKRLPLLGRELGRGMREFKESITGENKEHEEEPKPALTPAGERSEVAPADATLGTEPERAPADAGSERRS